MKSFVYTVTLIVIYILRRYSLCFRVLGPANAKFLSLSDCDTETLEWYKFSIDQRKYNRSMYIWEINLDNKYPLDDSLTLELNVSMKKEGGYKQGAFYMRKPLCEAMDALVGDLFTSFLDLILGKETCPIPVGSYKIEDFYFDNEKFNIPHLYGEYETTSITYKDDKMVKCQKSYFELVPKDSE